VSFEVKSSNASSRAHRPISAGIVGLGLMGTSIAACLLGRNQKVFAIESDTGNRRTARRRVSALLRGMSREGLLRRAPESLLELFACQKARHQ
jgi:3-hydroxyacyl-CoA dehydrogenase